MTVERKTLELRVIDSVTCDCQSEQVGRPQQRMGIIVKWHSCTDSEKGQQVTHLNL